MESKNNTVPRTAVMPQWDRSVHRLGITTLIIAMALSFGPFLYLYIKYGVRPSFGVLMTAWANVAVAYGAMYIIEPLSYFPSLGTSGSYMGWLPIPSWAVLVVAVFGTILYARVLYKKGKLH